MTRIIVDEDCGNSPKNIFLQKLTIAFAKRDARFILDSMIEEIRWNIVGGQLTEGKDQVTAQLERMKKEEVLQLTIRHIATHGKTGAVEGTMTMQDEKIRAFCDVYEFNGAKANAIREITSFVIPV